MNEHNWASQYEEAIGRLQSHIKISDGLLYLDITDGREAGVEDPIVFADLKRSLDETNKKIKNKQISLEDIHFFENSR